MLPIIAKGLPPFVDDALNALPLWLAVPLFVAGIVAAAWLCHRIDRWWHRPRPGDAPSGR